MILFNHEESHHLANVSVSNYTSPISLALLKGIFIERYITRDRVNQNVLISHPRDHKSGVHSEAYITNLTFIEFFSFAKEREEEK